jgi:hypothetical protein
MHAEIKNNLVLKIHKKLPINYKNISNFFAINPELLLDLSWSGNPDIKFYPYVEERPELPPNSQLIGPTYSIDEENKRVIGAYEVAEIASQPPFVPDSVTATQIRLWLIENNFSLESVEQAINSIEDQKTREIAKVQWEYAPYVDRNHPLIDVIGIILGLDADQIDQAFIEANQMG